MKQKLDQVLTENQNQHLRMSAELEDLSQTKVNLEERLIELIRFVYCLEGLVSFVVHNKLMCLWV